jgi:hypothetical protein
MSALRRDAEVTSWWQHLLLTHLVGLALGVGAATVKIVLLRRCRADPAHWSDPTPTLVGHQFRPAVDSLAGRVRQAAPGAAGPDPGVACGGD